MIAGHLKIKLKKSIRVDSNALQILARDSNGVAVGSCRFTPLPQDLDTLNYNTKPTTDIVQELFKVAEGSRLWWLAVLSTTRGKGLASQIIKFCEDYTGNAVKQRSRSVYVRLRANYKAHTMYSHLGYSQDSDIFWIDEQQLVWMRKIWKIQD